MACLFGSVLWSRTYDWVHKWVSVLCGLKTLLSLNIFDFLRLLLIAGAGRIMVHYCYT